MSNERKERGPDVYQRASNDSPVLHTDHPWVHVCLLPLQYKRPPLICYLFSELPFLFNSYCTTSVPLQLEAGAGHATTEI